MYQIVVTAALPNRASPTKFVNVATLCLEHVFAERLHAEAVLEQPDGAPAYPPILKLRMLLQHTYPGAVIAVGVRSVVTDIIPRTM